MLPFYIFMGRLIDNADTAIINDEVFVFDLDNTLHQMDDEICAQAEERAMAYLRDVVNVNDVESVVRDIKGRYSALLKGLLMERMMSYDEYYQYVYEYIDYEGCIRRDEDVINMLKSIGRPLYIMSNGTKAHVQRVLGIMGIEEYFEKVFYLGYEEDNYVGKPDRHAYELVSSIVRAKTVYFFDDKERNTSAAALHGWNAHLINATNLFDVVNGIVKNK